MSGARARCKGKRGERELARFFGARGYPARRGQQHSGGPDSPDVVIEDLPWLHVECKRTERLRIYDAIDQARRDAGGKKLPLVAYRANGSRWLAVLDLDDLVSLIREVGTIGTWGAIGN